MAESTLRHKTITASPRSAHARDSEWKLALALRLVYCSARFFAVSIIAVPLLNVHAPNDHYELNFAVTADRRVVEQSLASINGKAHRQFVQTWPTSPHGGHQCLRNTLLIDQSIRWELHILRFRPMAKYPLTTARLFVYLLRRSNRVMSCCRPCTSRS